MDRKHIVGVNQDDVKAIRVEGADAGSTSAGYGRNVAKVLLECERLPPESMLDCLGIDAGDVETYAGAHWKRVRGPASKGVEVGDGIDMLRRAESQKMAVMCLVQTKAMGLVGRLVVVKTVRG